MSHFPTSLLVEFEFFYHSGLGKHLIWACKVGKSYIIPYKCMSLQSRAETRLARLIIKTFFCHRIFFLAFLFKIEGIRSICSKSNIFAEKLLCCAEFNDPLWPDFCHKFSSWNIADARVYQQP